MDAVFLLRLAVPVPLHQGLSQTDASFGRLPFSCYRLLSYRPYRNKERFLHGERLPQRPSNQRGDYAAVRPLAEH